MKHRAIVGSALALGLVATVGFVACRGGAHPHGAHGNMEVAPHATAIAPSALPAASAAVATPGSAAPGEAPGEQLAAQVAAAKACAQPETRITNPPDGGVVFVNAWHRRDAGNIDRLQGVVDTLAEKSDVFRCCFDAWGREHPGSDGSLLLKIELAPDGTVETASVADDRSTIDHIVTRACVVDVAGSLSYPASPSNNATMVEFPFAVRAGAP